jgi:hypothetical protein
LIILFDFKIDNFQADHDEDEVLLSALVSHQSRKKSLVTFQTRKHRTNMPSISNHSSDDSECKIIQLNMQLPQRHVLDQGRTRFITQETFRINRT